MKTMIYKNISVDPDVCNGKPVVDKTRITVKTIMEHFFAGDTEDDKLKSFPSLTKQDLATCKEFTLRMMEHGYSVVEVLKAS